MSMQFNLEFLQLLNKPIIRMNDSPSIFNQLESLSIGVSLMLYKVSQHQRNRTGHSSQAMNHDAGSLQTIINVIGGLVEKFTNVKGFMIVSRNIQEIRNISAGVSQFYSLGRSEYSLDL